MPHRLCGLCQRSGRLLPVASEHEVVDYYRCDRCGHVWCHDKLSPNAPAVPVTSPAVASGSDVRATAVAIVQKVLDDANRALSAEQLDRITNAVAYDLETDQPASDAARLATRIIAMAEPPDSLAPVVKAVKKR